MRKRRNFNRMTRFYLSSLFAVALFVMTGCEPEMNDDFSGVDSYFEKNPYSMEEHEDPRPADLEISPLEVTLSIVGEITIFEGKGGVGPYTWSVSAPDKGSIENLGWSEAVYTCLKVGNNSVVVQDQEGHSAVATVLPAALDMAISPSAITLASGDSYAAFSVSGGVPPYRWAVANAALGTISYSADTSHVAGYTIVAGVSGVNMVTVIDADGQTASASVTQPAVE